MNLNSHMWLAAIAPGSTDAGKKTNTIFQCTKGPCYKDRKKTKHNQNHQVSQMLTGTSNWRPQETEPPFPPFTPARAAPLPPTPTLSKTIPKNYLSNSEDQWAPYLSSVCSCLAHPAVSYLLPRLWDPMEINLT